MAGKVALFITARGAGQAKGVMPAAGVLHHVQERPHVAVKELVEQPGAGIGTPHHRPGGGAVDHQLFAAVETVAAKGGEVRALLALDVDDLDEFALFHLIGHRRAARHGDGL